MESNMVQSVPDKIDVIFENQDFLVVSKPSGMLVHPTNNSQLTTNNTLTDWLTEKYPEIKTVGDPSTSSGQAPSTSSGQANLRPGIVHRLDKETSGVMVIAKTQEAFEILKTKFKNREIKKAYLSLVLGKMNADSGEIILPIAKSKKSTKRTTRIRPGQKNSEAKTNWKLLKTYSDQSGNILSLLEVVPKTGRTHQIRVHLAAISHPVAGDYLYGRKTTRSFRETLQRIFLHAKSLEFYWDKSFYSFESEIPDELKEFFASLVEINE